MQINNVGNTVEGHVLDINKTYFKQKLRQFDPRLYLKWNPKKRQGHGMWELRIKPLKKTAVYVGSMEGYSFIKLEDVENDLTHHILDLPTLDMRVFTRLREMDAWTNKTMLEDADYLAEQMLIKQELEIDDMRRRMIKENKRYFSDMYEAVRSGVNPASLFFGRYGK